MGFCTIRSGFVVLLIGLVCVVSGLSNLKTVLGMSMRPSYWDLGRFFCPDLYVADYGVNEKLNACVCTDFQPA